MEQPVEPATYIGFKTALKAGDVEKAFSIAKNLTGLLSLLDALELTLLAGEKGWDGPFQSCAARWLARVAVEKELKLDSLLQAGAVFQEAGRGEANDAYTRLAYYLD